MKFCKKLAVYILVFVLSVTLFMPCAKAYSTDYPNTWNNTGNYIEDLIGIAMTQVGYYGNTTTGTKYGAWYGESFTYSQWCAMFISWCANEAEIPTTVIHKTARANNYRNSGTYHYKDDYTPVRGDLVLFNPMTGGYTGTYYWPEKNSDGTYSSSSHVAIVCSYDSKTEKIWIVHGNSTDDKVCFNSVSVASDAIQAFVTPSYSGSSGSSGSAASPYYDYVNGNNVNLRSGPGTDHSKLGSYNKGTSVEILETVTNVSGEVWYKVEIVSSGVTGYMLSEFITVINNSSTVTDHYINGDSVRLRSGAGTDFEEIAKYNSGTSVKLLGVYPNADDESEKWYNVKVISSGKTGYIRSDFIKIVTSIQTPYVNDDDVNLRSSETTSSDSLGKYDSGTKVEILDTVKNSKGETWNKVIIFSDMVQGYIRSDFISVYVAPPEPEYDYTNTSYQLRSAPGTWNDVVGTVANEAKVQILEASYDTDGDKWFYIRVESTGLEGYIYYKRVKINSTEKDTVAVASSVLSSPDGSTVLCTASKGDTVTVLSITYDGSGKKWLKVRITKNSKTYEGYINAENVALNGVNRKNVTFTHGLEAPATGTAYGINDTITVRGWAFSNVGEAPCFYSLDGGARTPLTVEARSDIKKKYSACPSNNVGFTASFSADSLSYGEHTVEIFASSDVTVQSLYKLNFNIADGAAPSGKLLDVADIDDTGYTLVVSAVDNLGISAVYTSTVAEGVTVENIANLISGGVYVVRVNTAQFSVSDAEYTTKVYVRDIYNNITLIDEISLNPARYRSVVVTFDANGGSGAPNAETLSFNGALTVPDILPEREGYSFAGWSESKDGEAQYEAGDTCFFNASVVLYAVWVEKTAGDCNCDGVISTMDLAYMKLALSGNAEVDLFYCDFNSDGSFNTVDLAEMKIYLAG